MRALREAAFERTPSYRTYEVLFASVLCEIGPPDTASKRIAKTITIDFKFRSSLKARDLSGNARSAGRWAFHRVARPKHLRPHDNHQPSRGGVENQA